MDDSEDVWIPPLQAHIMCAWKYKHVHLGMPYSKVGTDGSSLSIPVLKLMEDFTIQDKVITYKSNGRYNFKTCQDVLEGKFTNTIIYRTQKTMFWQDRFAHALQGACKEAILDCKYEGEEGKIVRCVATVQKILVTCVTWLKKSSLSSRELIKAQNNVGFKPHKMLKPINNNGNI